ncbi:hypothetical protein ACLOJK_021278 [Asimina triloba]
MGLKELFVASSVPVLEVLIVTSVGAFLAVDRVNLLGPSARKSINNVITEEDDVPAYNQIPGSSDKASKFLLEDNTESLISVEDPLTTISRPQELVETEKATRLKNILKIISEKVDLKKVFAPSTIGAIFLIFIAHYRSAFWFITSHARTTADSRGSTTADFRGSTTIVGFAVGLITPIRKAFIGDSAPLRAIEDSAVLLR